ncbi:hypothetical protein FQA39_LY17403 [Lamprigera yunnana]|nr:hypothetical protein FQA39_LY17403 [Lamprigera yunnana]
MCAKFLFAGILAVQCVIHMFVDIQATPVQLMGKEVELSKKFVDYILPDPEFQHDLKEFVFNDIQPNRAKRQAEQYPEEFEPPKPGFFDRAAKFITELLQRFLKWVNTDENKK